MIMRCEGESISWNKGAFCKDVESAEACECVGMRGGNRNSLPFPLVLVF